MTVVIRVSADLPESIDSAGQETPVAPSAARIPGGVCFGAPGMARSALTGAVPVQVVLAG